MPLSNLRPAKEEVITPKPIETIKTKFIPQIPIIETISSDFNLNLELEELSKTSEFKRLIYKALMGKVHRGSMENLSNTLEKAIKEFREFNY